MITFKQLEAIYWIAKLGSFGRAARKLHTTQSAISKRIQELEAIAATPLFDRSRRAARLTERGEEFLAIAQEMLHLRARGMELIGSSELARRRLRVGVTEMTALTWLPRLVAALRHSFPLIDLQPEVESSQTLHRRLQQDMLDIVIIPDAFRSARFESVPVGKVKMTWMCTPELSVPEEVVPLAELNNWTILSQDERSGSGLIYKQWLQERGVRLDNCISSNSLIALLGLAVSGAGVCYLPRQAANALLLSGRLRTVQTDPELPPLDYVAMFRSGSMPGIETLVLDQARTCCDFSLPIYGSSTGA